MNVVTDRSNRQVAAHNWTSTQPLPSVGQDEMEMQSAKAIQAIEGAGLVTFRQRLVYMVQNPLSPVIRSMAVRITLGKSVSWNLRLN